MNCKECQDLIFEHIDGLLDVATAKAVETHAATCSDCTALLVGERNATLTLAAQLDAEACSCELSRKAKIAIAASAAALAAESNNPLSHNSFSRWIGPLAAAILLTVFATQLHTTTRPDSRLVHTQAQPRTLQDRSLTNEFSQFILCACISNAYDRMALNKVYSATH